MFLQNCISLKSKDVRYGIHMMGIMLLNQSVSFFKNLLFMYQALSATVVLRGITQLTMQVHQMMESINAVYLDVHQLSHLMQDFYT